MKRKLLIAGFGLLLIALLVFVHLSVSTRHHLVARWPDGDTVRLVSVQTGTRPEYSTAPKLFRLAINEFPMLSRVYHPLTMGGTVPEGTGVYLLTQSDLWKGLADQVEIFDSSGRVTAIDSYASAHKPRTSLHFVFLPKEKTPEGRIFLRLRRGTNYLQFPVVKPKS